MKKSMLFLFIFCLVLLLGSSSFNLHAQSAEKVETLFEKLKWRCVGPAAMGGRTVDIDVVEKTPWIIYAAIGPSGVWKSENNGITWNPVFDKESTVSVGDIAIAQSHPNIIWVGSGEATIRNSITIGDGVYKSVDGGKKWTNMGLKETRHISRVVINPGDPNIVYVAAMGHLWGPNEERGIYKTLDGGKSWKKVLYINEDTGFADLAIDPSDSLTLYAAAYEFRRFPYYFSSGGQNSGLYKTTDGGETWKKLAKDLPEGIIGRIAIDVSRSNPDVVYALVEHKEPGIFRSEDKGESWKRTGDAEKFRMVNNRPFYYSQIRIDPNNDKVIYVFSTGSFRSDNMGEKFKPISGGTHSDHHALWIDPKNPLHLIDGNDGGIDFTYDGGKRWHPIRHMVLAEVYQIGFDMRDPYYVYCGLQDNGLWGGPSATYDVSGITNDDWFVVGGGDGFYAQVDPSDHTIIYGNWQTNNLYRYDLRIKRSKTIRPIASLKEPAYRYNWNSPIYISPHDSKTVYTGGNFLFRTTDGGQSWTKISPDLSTNDPEKLKDSGGPINPDNSGAEVHCTIITISESSVEKGVIWCGTDDGNVQITRDSGQTWNNVVKNIKGLPANTWCSRIEASHYDAGTAYAAFDGHRSDDYNTYAYKTTDFGKTWISLKGNLPFGWIHVIREDLRNPNLLFVGTEFSIYASLDSGRSWFSLKNDLPTVAVRDIAVHPRANDLIIGTHGRGVWIMDDISPLQEMSDEVLESDHHIFSIRSATQFFPSASRESFGKPDYAAKNPTYGMTINTFFKSKPKDRPQILIKNEKEEEIYKIRLPTREGLHRSMWNLQFLPRTKEGKQIKPSGTGFMAPPYASAGEYKVELNVGENNISKKGTVRPDPRIKIDENERGAQLDSLVKVFALSRKMGLSITAGKNIRRQVDKLNQSLEEKLDTPQEVQTAIKNFEEKFSQIENEVMPTGIFSLSTMEGVLRGGSYAQQIMFLGMSIGSYPGAPTETDLLQLKELTEEADKIVDLINTFIKEELPRLNEILKKHDVKPLSPPKKVEL